MKRRNRNCFSACGFTVYPQKIFVQRDPMPIEPVALRGRILWCLGIAAIYEDGDGWSPVFRYWNPLTLLLFLSLIPVCAVLGEKIFKVMPFKISGFFEENPDKLIWWSPLSSRQGFLCQIKTKKK